MAGHTQQVAMQSTQQVPSNIKIHQEIRFIYAALHRSNVIILHM